MFNFNKIHHYLIKNMSVNVILLVAIYSITFFGLLFANIQDTAFMKIDPGSITKSIYALFEKPYYNMLDSYHSRYYGWSYFFINFILLAPFKLVGLLDNLLVANFLIRLIMFFIGLATVIAFYTLSLKLVKIKIFSLLAALYFMFNPAVSHFWHTIHPESTGMLFYLIGLIIFISYLEEKSLSKYFYCIALLALSSLAKQPFFIMALPVILYIFLDHCNWRLREVIAFIYSSNFWKLFGATALLGGGVLFIVHPYAIIDMPLFIKYQTAIVDKHSTQTALLVALENWVNALKLSHLIWLHVILMIVAIAGVIIKVKISRLFLYSVVASNLIMLIFMSMERYFFNINYIAPLFMVFILNILIVIKYIYESVKNEKILLAIRVFLPAIILYYILVAYTGSMANVLKPALLHKNTTKHLGWEYILKLPIETRIVFDSNVAVPPQYRSHGCHVWQGCGKQEFLENYVPDYFILFADYKYMNKEVIFDYMDKNGFCSIDELKPTVKSEGPRKIDELMKFSLYANVYKIQSLVHSWKRKDIVGNKITVFKNCS